jgi:hypothetical protein
MQTCHHILITQTNPGAQRSQCTQALYAAQCSKQAVQQLDGRLAFPHQPSTCKREDTTLNTKGAAQPDPLQLCNHYTVLLILKLLNTTGNEHTSALATRHSATFHTLGQGVPE